MPHVLWTEDVSPQSSWSSAGSSGSSRIFLQCVLVLMAAVVWCLSCVNPLMHPETSFLNSMLQFLSIGCPLPHSLHLYGFSTVGALVGFQLLPHWSKLQFSPDVTPVMWLLLVCWRLTVGALWGCWCWTRCRDSGKLFSHRLHWFGFSPVYWCCFSWESWLAPPVFLFLFNAIYVFF